HGRDRLAHAPHVDLRLPLVRVDDVEPAPIPELHVDRTRPVLVIAGDDQPAALARQLRGEIERPLRADALDDALTHPALRQVPNLADDGLMILERDPLVGAHPPREIARKRATGDRDDAGSGAL